MNELLDKADAFDNALVALKKARPDEVTFIVPDRLFRSVGSFADAWEIQAKMEGFKQAAIDAGYSLSIWQDMASMNMDWNYRLKRRRGVSVVHMPHDSGAMPMETRGIEQ